MVDVADTHATDPHATDAWTAAMRRGDYAAAFALGDAVIAARSPDERDDARVDYHRRWVWDGRAFDGEDVLVRCYHGLGDTIQFARFLPLLGQRARSVTVEAPARLHDLLATIPGVDRLLAFDHAAPAKPFACDIEITELPQARAAPPVRGGRGPNRPRNSIARSWPRAAPRGWRAGRARPRRRVSRAAPAAAR